MAIKNLSNVYSHIEMINSELGIVKKDMAVLRNDMQWIKEELKTQSQRQWYIVAGIIITVILAISNLIGGG